MCLKFTFVCLLKVHFYLLCKKNIFSKWGKCLIYFAVWTSYIQIQNISSERKGVKTFWNCAAMLSATVELCSYWKVLCLGWWTCAVLPMWCDWSTSTQLKFQLSIGFPGGGTSISFNTRLHSIRRIVPIKYENKTDIVCTGVGESTLVHSFSPNLPGTQISEKNVFEIYISWLFHGVHKH